MALANDILLDTDGDLDFINGDFAIGFSDNQHIQDILESFPGSWKEYPLVGVGLDFYLNSTGKEQTIKNEITRQLTSDGFSIDELEVEETGAINVKATRL